MTVSRDDINENDSPNQRKIKENVNQKYKEWKNLRQLNQGLDVGLTLSTIFFGLVVVVLSTESIKMDEN